VSRNIILRNGVALFSAALVLANCSSEWSRRRERSDEVYLTAPTNYRADILGFMRTYLNDPRGVRDAFLSEPSKQTVEGIERYALCLRYNPRKSNGQYAGVRDSIVLFAEGKLDRIVENPEGRPDRPNLKELCKDAAYQPFVELERLR
jgi:hypothetical protein